MKRKFSGILVLVAICSMMLVSCGSYGADQDYFALYQDDETIELTKDRYGNLIIMPLDENGEACCNTGIIFYPGGAVNYDAYLPLMVEISHKGFFTAIIKMPADYAVFDIDKAKEVRYSTDFAAAEAKTMNSIRFNQKYAGITHWYMAGHSLGGAMAGSFLADEYQSTHFEGLILMGAYTTSSLKNTSLKVLSVYGSEDHVLNREKYSKNWSNLPENTYERVIEGGNHGNFGNYGHQKGDGEASISREQQQALTAGYIEQLINNEITK